MKSPPIRQSILLPIGLVLALGANPARAQGTGEIYVTNQSGQTLNSYSLSGAPLTSTPVAGVPYGLAVSGGSLYMSNAGPSEAGPPSSGSLAVYDAPTGTLINPAIATGLNEPLGIAIAGNNIYTANWAGETPGAGSVGEYTTSGTVVNPSLVSGLTGPESVTVWGNELFVASDNQNMPVNTGVIGVYNATTGAVINASLISAGVGDIFGFITIANGHLYVTESGGSSATVGEYDPTTGAPINASLVTGLGFPNGIAIAGNSLYVADAGLNQIGEYDLNTGAPINPSLITGLDFPRGLVVLTPEPQSIVLLIIGTAGLLAFARRNRRTGVRFGA